jgi:hypothetical protein
MTILTCGLLKKSSINLYFGCHFLLADCSNNPIAIVVAAYAAAAVANAALTATAIILPPIPIIEPIVVNATPVFISSYTSTLIFNCIGYFLH